MHVVVIGGTGLIGSRVVNHLRDHGAVVAVGSLRTGVDAYSGRGLSDLIAGAEVVVDATNVNRPSYDYEQTHSFFATCTKNILVAERRAGVQHHVGISIIGAGQLDSEYFRGKTAQELLVRESPVPHSLLRTTLLYEFIPKLVDHSGFTHLVRLPPARVQPIAADDVARELARLAIGRPLNGTYEITGPEVHSLDELGRRVLAAAGDNRPVMADDDAFYLGARLEPGTEALLPAWRTTTTTFDDWQSTVQTSPAGSHS